MTKIEHIKPGEFSINGKRIYKNMEGKWIADEELTTAESKAFKMHIQKLDVPKYFSKTKQTS